MVRAAAAARLRLLSDHPLTWLDVFTRRRLTGNQLAVVHDADGLGDATMAAFARETRLSETTFVQSAGAPGADYRNRIFMPLGEIPFAGHPSLGTAVAVALARGETAATYVQETGAGRQPIDVETGAGGLARASMLQEPPSFGPELDPDEILPIAGLDAADADPELPIQVVATGVPQVVAPVRAAALARIKPAAYEPLRALLERFDAITFFLAACDPGAGTARARSFYPDPAAVVEDPATGSAAGPLMAYLHERTGIDRLTLDQGVEMDRPSRLDCVWEGDRPRVGGDAVVVATGTVSL